MGAKMLTEVHKTQRMASALTFLQHYYDEGDKFLDKIVTGDETWVKFVNVETKEQSQQWMHTHLPLKPRKFKQSLSNRKLMATVFGDRKGVLLIEFMEPGITITSETHCETLKKLCRAIQNKRRGMMMAGVVLLHDNAHPHIAACTQALLQQFCWDLFDHPPYSPDLAPSDFHLFTWMKVWLGTQRFNMNEELMNGVKGWLSSQTATFFDVVIQKLVSRYDRCLKSEGDYVEK
jgi:histone-lysine N-methyltransferase SETMAR